MTPRKAGEIPPSIGQHGGQWYLGVDVRGLAELANKLYRYADASKTPIKGLEKTVKQIVSDAGWKDDDANAFEDAWTADASDAQKLSIFIEDTAEVVDNLATSVANLQISMYDGVKALDEKADTMSARELIDKKTLLWRAKKKEAERLQKEAAGKLTTLHARKEGEWSVLDATKKRSEDKNNVPEDIRDAAGDAYDELDDSRPDDAFPWDDFWLGGGIGAGFGGAVGTTLFPGLGTFGGIFAGSALGLAVFGTVGTTKWISDQVDDLF